LAGTTSCAGSKRPLLKWISPASPSDAKVGAHSAIEAIAAVANAIDLTKTIGLRCDLSDSIDLRRVLRGIGSSCGFEIENDSQFLISVCPERQPWQTFASIIRQAHAYKSIGVRSVSVRGNGPLSRWDWREQPREFTE
jgi:hypothetical protein